MSQNPLTRQFHSKEPSLAENVQLSAVQRERDTSTVNVSRETLESIKRTLYNAIDKLERMASDK